MNNTPKKTMSRRHFMQALSLGVGSAFLAPRLLHAAIGHIVVVGGGFAGATCAKYLKKWSPQLEVTLIEPNSVYYSPIMSNLVVTGQRSLSSLGFRYDTLSTRYGINVIHSRVDDIDKTAQSVQLSNGNTLNYDRLVLAPGIDFQPISGLASDDVLHAWQSGSQVSQLNQQLVNMPDGGNFILSIPKAPYRCPPGPYERSCVVADYLKTHKPNARITVLDANAGIQAEPEIIQHAYDVDYVGIVDYIPNADILAVDSNSKTVSTTFGDYQGDVLNLIPNQQAGKILFTAGLVNDSTQRWAGVNPLSYESTAANNIHIIGDSQATNQPKAGHIANAEAKVCADAIIRLMSGLQPYDSPKTNSACYTPISATTASWLTAVFEYNPASQQMQVVAGSNAAATQASTRHYQMMQHWSENLFADTFS